ncbi:MAG: DUF262 domain-containing protein [Eubacterium sp.]|nr:DUF262 domain-containing protein [Eubacterium sp.]
MAEKTIEPNVIMENEEELENLMFSGEGESPLFSSVRVVRKDFSVFELYRKYNKNPRQLMLDVDFQRKSVWDPKQKRELIESILMGLPLPIIYLKQQNNATYAVVDGKQRLSTLFGFIDNKFCLKDLKILSFLNGKYFKDLTGDYGIYQSQLEDYQLYIHLILPPTPDKILFDIFDRVNRGGTKLNKQEIRNALYHGKGMDMISSVNRSQIFQKVTRIKYKDDRRMKGSYLITRFLSFYLLFENLLYKDGKPYNYSGDIDDLIEVSLATLNRMSDKDLQNLERLISESLEISNDILGDGAFRREMNRSKPINMNIFETTLYFMNLINNDKDFIPYGKIRLALKKTIMSDDFLDYIGNSRENTIKVHGRFGMMDELFRELHDD